LYYFWEITKAEMSSVYNKGRGMQNFLGFWLWKFHCHLLHEICATEVLATPTEASSSRHRVAGVSL